MICQAKEMRWGRMAVDSAVLLPSRGQETSHQLCGYVEKPSAYAAAATVKPAVAVTPAGSWMAAKVGVSEVYSSLRGILIPNCPNCGRATLGLVLQSCAGESLPGGCA